jgi:hypothetical protein
MKSISIDLVGLTFEGHSVRFARFYKGPERGTFTTRKFSISQQTILGANGRNRQKRPVGSRAPTN